MDVNRLIDGLLVYICLVVIVAFHEFGHAWTAFRCGDDSQRAQGRLTLNPIAHLDRFGTVILPLFFVLMAAFEPGWGGFLFGWGKPVMVDPSRLKNRRLNDLWITLAGPAMNVVLAALVMLVARGAAGAGHMPSVAFCLDLAGLSMFLCFFNLLPVPPLDGANALRAIVGMKDETYLRMSQFGWIFLLVLINIRPVFHFLGYLAAKSVQLLALAAGLGGLH